MCQSNPTIPSPILGAIAVRAAKFNPGDWEADRTKRVGGWIPQGTALAVLRAEEESD